jgi:hypothetical protein
MPDDPQFVRRIDWRSAFPFTQIFRTFRIAIHPSKLILALLTLCTVYVGGNVLDWIWPSAHRAVPDEISLYAQTGSDRAEFNRARENARKAVLDSYNAELKRIGKEGGSLADLKWRYRNDRQNTVKRLNEDYENLTKKLREDLSKATKDEERASIRRELDEAAPQRDRRIRAAFAEASEQWERARAVRGEPLFRTFFETQLSYVNSLVRAVRENNWMGRMGVWDSLIGFFTVGPAWAIAVHPVYFTIFFLFFLACWAIFGGAIARIAAVHVARDEKISIRQALRFSTSKFLSFLSAPIIPLAIIFGVGLVVALGGFLLNVPFFGPIIVGALFFLALAAGFIMTLVGLGLAGGFNLMYPTIAVEGSDSFDAISRSFSYLYARPWRLLLYSVTAIIYGALTYLFVRFFIYTLLWLTHSFLGLFVWLRADSTRELVPALWPSPYQNRLSYDLDFFSLSSGETAGAFLISFWVYLVIGMLGAFAISFYFSASTIIYYLMRHEVDATEMDDVYLEQSDEEFAEVTMAPSPAGAAAPGATSGESSDQPPPT